MEKRLKVLLYGDTLVLAGLRASLLSYANLELIDFEVPQITEQNLDALGPEVIIYDVGAVQTMQLQKLTMKLPNLLMVGIDPSQNRGLVWSRQQLLELSTSDLVEVIARFMTQES